MYLTESSGDPTKATVDGILETQADHLGTEPFVVYGPDDRAVSYREMNRTANRIGNALRELGVAPGDRVSMLVADPLRTLFTFFGIQKCGAVYSPINTELTGQALAYQLNDTAPELLVLQDEFAGRLNEVRESLGHLPNVVRYDTGADADPLDDAFAVSSFEALTEGSAADPGVDTAWDDVASVLYTSGTTGDPKGVVHQHRYIVNYCETEWRIADAAGATADEYAYVKHTSLPLYHIAGLYADVLGAMVAGGSVAVWDQFSPEAFWDRIDKYGATHATLLATMISWLLNQPESDDDHRNTLDKVSLVPLLDNAVEMAERFGFDFIATGHGSTETGSVLYGLVHAATGEHATPDDVRRSRPPAAFVDRVTDVGFPVVDHHPGQGWLGNNWKEEKVEVAVLDDRDERVDAGDVGEFAVRPRAPAVLFREYDGKPERTVESWRNLWYHTGDAVRREGDYYYFVDRKGSVIRRRGENISSGQVQAITDGHEKVERSAAFPVPAAEGGEDEVAIAVQPTADASLEESELRAYLDEEMPAFMRPKYVLLVDEIPTTPTNKMEKYKLRERLMAVESLEE